MKEIFSSGSSDRLLHKLTARAPDFAIAIAATVIAVLSATPAFATHQALRLVP